MSAHLTIEGNLAADPELRFTKDGKAIAKFRVADTARVKDRDSGEWSDGATLWVSVSLWGSIAEAFAENARKGDRVLTTGRLIASEWQKDGETRHGLDLNADTAAVVFKSQKKHDAAPF